MPKHDSLCITVQQKDIPLEQSLKYCHCMCPSCWVGEGVVHYPQKTFRTIEAREAAEKMAKENGTVLHKTKGRCICRECTCHDIYTPAM